MRAAWVHLGAFVVWVGTWVVSIELAGGQTQIVADTPGEYIGLGVLFASCFTLVGSAAAARLEVGGSRATSGPLMAAAAMLGGFVLAAVRRTRESAAPPRA